MNPLLKRGARGARGMVYIMVAGVIRDSLAHNEFDILMKNPSGIEPLHRKLTINIGSSGDGSWLEINI